LGDELLTLEELRNWLKVPKVWVYRQTRENNIPFIKLGKYLRFEKSKIEKWIADNRSE
jgi:excisionase family DNA binding protein